MISSCQEVQDGFTALEETAAFIDRSDQQTGNLGIVFDDGKYDFGIAKAYDENTNLTLTLTNRSSKNLYFTGMDFGEAVEHFSVISSKCPVTPSVFPAGFSCELIVEFAPQEPNTILTIMAAVYGLSLEEATDLRTEVFAQGRGISPLEFKGAEELDNVTTTSFDVLWTENADVVNYNVMIAFGEEPSDNDFSFKKSVPNTGGTVNVTTVDGLTPETFYSIKVNAIDLLGNTVDSDGFKTGKTLPNNPPDIDQVDWLTNGLPNKYYTGATSRSFDIRDANTLDDIDIDGDPITYDCTYSVTGNIATDVDCTSLPNQDGTAAIYNRYKGTLVNWVPRNDWVNEKITFTITALDTFNKSDTTSSFAVDIEQGTPSAPLFKKACDVDSNSGASGIIDINSCSLSDASPRRYRQ